MSTALTSARAAAPHANALFRSITPKQCRMLSTAVEPAQSTDIMAATMPMPDRRKPHYSAKSLIRDMHRQLYPNLYDESGKPKKQVKEVDLKSPKKTNLKMALMGRKARMMQSGKRDMKVYHPRQKDIKKVCPDPIAAVTQSQIALLDPTGARTRLFAKDNPESAKVGDILLVRQRTGDPFAGVCINIRRRGVDTAILLRGQLTRVGVEMWYKIYSPLVEGIEVVQRALKRARRARLTYMRKVKHDRGSVENVVRVYLRQKAALGTAEGGKKKGAAAAAAAAGGKKKGNKRGKRR